MNIAKVLMTKSEPLVNELDWILREPSSSSSGACDGFLLDTQCICGGGMPNASQEKFTESL